MARRSHALAAKNSTKKLSMLRVQSRCRQFCRLKAQVTQSEWTARPYILRVNPPSYLLACCKSFHLFVTVKPGFHMIASIAAIAQKNKFSDRSDNNRWDRTFSISAIVVAAIRAAIAGEWFLYDHCDRADGWSVADDRWRSQRSQRSKRSYGNQA